MRKKKSSLEQSFYGFWFRRFPLARDSLPMLAPGPFLASSDAISLFPAQWPRVLERFLSAAIAPLLV